MRIIIAAILPFLFFQACQKEIIIETQPYEPKVVIECLLMPGTTPKLYLSESVAFFESNVIPASTFIYDADVRISSDGEENLLTVDSIFDEFFCRWQPFYKSDQLIKANTDYQLNIAYKSKTYFAQTTTDVEAVQVDSVYFVPSFNDVYGEHQGVAVEFLDPAGMANYYRFYMIREVDSTVQTIDDFEYSSVCLGDNITTIADIGWFVHFDRNANGLPAKIIMEPSHTFKQGDSADVGLQMLDINAATYYDQLDKAKQAALNPFIEPVFLDNQIEGALGVFGSMNLSNRIEIVFPEDND